jgi:geranylgeranyl reductase
MVIGADGANSKGRHDIGAGDYDFAIAFQGVSRSATDMAYYRILLCVSDDVSP